MKSTPFIIEETAKQQWSLIFPEARDIENLVQESVKQQLFPLTIVAAHKMPTFVACIIVPYHEILLGKVNDELKNSWFNTKFAPQFTNTSTFRFEETFTEEEAKKMGANLDMLKDALGLIKIVFPFLFNTELKDNRTHGGNTIFFSVKKVA